MLPVSSALSVGNKPNLTSQDRNHVKRGPEVGKRIRDLQKYNKNIRGALGQFEKNEKRNGQKPKLDEAVSVIQDPAGGTAASTSANADSKPFRNISLKRQDPDYSAYGVEMILIPTFYDDDEWQGTVIINGFDPSGNYLGQYVADVAMVVDSTETWMFSMNRLTTKAKGTCCTEILDLSWGRLVIPKIRAHYNQPSIRPEGSTFGVRM